MPRVFEKRAASTLCCTQAYTTASTSSSTAAASCSASSPRGQWPARCTASRRFCAMARQMPATWAACGARAARRAATFCPRRQCCGRGGPRGPARTRRTKRSASLPRASHSAVAAGFATLGTTPCTLSTSLHTTSSPGAGAYSKFSVIGALPRGRPLWTRRPLWTNRSGAGSSVGGSWSWAGVAATGYTGLQSRSWSGGLHATRVPDHVPDWDGGRERSASAAGHRTPGAGGVTPLCVLSERGC